MKHLLTTTAAAVLLLVASVPAQADLISIGLQQAGFNSGNITTEATGTGAASLGPIPYGTFTVNQVNAQDQTVLGNPGLENSQSLNISGNAAGTLIVSVTAQGLTNPAAVYNFLSTFAVNADNGAITGITERTFLDPNDAVYGDIVPLDSATFTGLQTQVFNTIHDLSGAPFSVTEVYSISATGQGNVNATIDLSATQVPEPSSLILLIGGLVGALGLAYGRRKEGMANA